MKNYKGLQIKSDALVHDEVVSLILSKINKGSKILDYGAGEGALSERLSDEGYSVIAADIDEDNFRTSKAKFHKLNFDSDDQVNHFISTFNSSFDVVIGIEVIEHVEDQWRYVRQLNSLLKPGGLIIISTPNITSWLSRFMFLIRGRFHQFLDHDLEYGHINPISPWELNLIAKSVGFTEIQIRPGGYLPSVYLSKSIKILFVNIIMLLLKPFMSGLTTGWCVILSARKGIESSNNS